MTRILTGLQTDHLDNERWVRITSPFVCELDCLREAGLQSRVTVQAGFIQDFESIPIVRGRNKRGGTIHDYLSCHDSIPVVTKQLAAEAYWEMNVYTDSIDHSRNYPVMVADWARRWSKWAVVRVWPGYFHKRSIYATCKELTGLEGDPYITIEKLKALIVKTKEVSADLKEVDADTKEMVKETDHVTEGLKDAIEEKKA